jgi:hypothetical protein
MCAELSQTNPPYDHIDYVEVTVLTVLALGEEEV